MIRGRNSFAICFSAIIGDIFCRKIAFSIGVGCLVVRISSRSIEKISISRIFTGIIMQMHDFSSGKRVLMAKSLFLPATITYESGLISLTIGGCRIPCFKMDCLNVSSIIVSLSGETEYEKSAKSMSEISRLLGYMY